MLSEHQKLWVQSARGTIDTQKNAFFQVEVPGHTPISVFPWPHSHLWLKTLRSGSKYVEVSTEACPFFFLTTYVYIYIYTHTDMYIYIYIIYIYIITLCDNRLYYVCLIAAYYWLLNQFIWCINNKLFQVTSATSDRTMCGSRIGREILSFHAIECSNWAKRWAKPWHRSPERPEEIPWIFEVKGSPWKMFFCEWEILNTWKDDFLWFLVIFRTLKWRYVRTI